MPHPGTTVRDDAARTVEPMILAMRAIGADPLTASLLNRPPPKDVPSEAMPESAFLATAANEFAGLDLDDRLGQQRVVRGRDVVVLADR